MKTRNHALGVLRQQHLLLMGEMERLASKLSDPSNRKDVPYIRSDFEALVDAFEKHERMEEAFMLSLGPLNIDNSIKIRRDEAKAKADRCLSDFADIVEHSYGTVLAAAVLASHVVSWMGAIRLHLQIEEESWNRLEQEDSDACSVASGVHQGDS